MNRPFAAPSPVSLTGRDAGQGLAFVKMNGLGNDFAVVEAPRSAFDPSIDHVRRWAKRDGGGVGFDQLVAISKDGDEPPLLRFWNADGEPVGACGNGSRCAAWLLMEAAGANEVALQTTERPLFATREGPFSVSVDFGQPRLDWQDIPLAEEMDTRRVELQVGPIDAPLFHTPGCVSMGNPHVVFFVDDAEAVQVQSVGSMIENHPLFPEGVNVSFCQVLAPDRIRNRVWERGSGLTKACGTGACAAVVAAARRGLSQRRARVLMDGGTLLIDWRESDDHVIMTGPVEIEFTGRLS